MRPFFTLVAILAAYTLQGQYRFSGQVSEDFINLNVYLSLVEDYRKTSRVYLDQVFQTTVADSLGYFTFEGSSLPDQNRIYRIHVDGCEEGLNGKNHFLRECSTTESLLFIANNNDTISIPLLSGQAFCELTSSNPASGLLLEMEALKEEMIVDFIEGNSQKAHDLKFKKWFKNFQDFAIQSNEALVQLYVFDFLSDRKNETYEYFLEDVKENDFYQNLLRNLIQQNSSSTYHIDYMREYVALTSLQTEESHSEPFYFNYLKYIIFFLVGIPTFILVWNNKRSRSSRFHKEALTNQESKIFHLIKLGKSNKEIASELFISHSTVKTHVNNIYKKLGIASRDELQSKF